jgi:hypothetical protein
MHSITTGVVQCGSPEACRAGLLGVTRSEPGVPTLVWRRVYAQLHVHVWAMEAILLHNVVPGFASALSRIARGGIAPQLCWCYGDFPAFFKPFLPVFVMILWGM